MNLPPCTHGFKTHAFVGSYLCVRCKKSWKELWEELTDRATKNKKAIFTLQTRPKQGDK